MSDILDTSIAVHEDVVGSRVGSETVLLHLESSIYFGLDEVGTLVWDALKQGQMPRKICAEIAAEYNVDTAVIESDVRRLIDELIENHIILIM